MLRLLTIRAGNSHRKVQQIDRIQSELAFLFETVQEKKALSETLRIFPLYFNTNYVEQFCKSSKISQYLKYINRRHYDRTQAKHVKQQFQMHGLSKGKLNAFNMAYLEAYLDWLSHQCQSFSQTQNQYLMEFINLERPEKWFQQEEKTQPRVFIYHHGPTNSGKSTSAIEDLKNLGPHQLGIYMAPLRLLAWEYQQKLGNCSLITGQQKEFKNSNLISCTIEAAPLKEYYQVAVIDEIQMIGDPERGWAWTKAVLATRAKRIHLCGDERALGIVSNLVQLTGDVLEERRYSRLSKLILIHKLFKLEKLQPGDCIINFSMKKLIMHRNDINKMLYYKGKSGLPDKQSNNQKDKDLKQEEISTYPNRSAIIYGKLPPQCRKKQATAFNNNQYPYLVATNAIGMGLNLNIKKIILMDHQRQTGDGTREDLEEHQIQQIAGRAGRGKETGYVQCANQQTLQRVKSALSTVNKTYGIQLQNLKDDNNDAQNIEPQSPLFHKRSRARGQLYNHLLKRQMTEQQFQIKKACFYFTPEYIADFKPTLQHMTQVDLSMSETIQFLSSFCQLSHSYFLQQTSNLKYIVSLLQDKKMQIQDLLIFYTGLQLSKPAFRSKKKAAERQLAKQIEKAHRNIIKNFMLYRRVPLPSFLVANYQDNYSRYKYMDQISELQFHYNLLQSYVWLWSKYQFAFYQVKTAIQIKERLSEKINQVLMDNLFSNPEAKAQAESPNYPSFQEAKTMRRNKHKHPNAPHPQQELKRQGSTHHHHLNQKHLTDETIAYIKSIEEIYRRQASESGVIAEPKQSIAGNGQGVKKTEENQ